MDDWGIGRHQKIKRSGEDGEAPFVARSGQAPFHVFCQWLGAGSLAPCLDGRAARRHNNGGVKGGLKGGH